MYKECMTLDELIRGGASPIRRPVPKTFEDLVPWMSDREIEWFRDQFCPQRPSALDAYLAEDEPA